MKKEKKNLVGFGLIGSIVAVMLIVIAFVGYDIELRMQNQLKSNIQEMAEQNSAAVGKVLAQHSRILREIASKAGILPEEERTAYVCGLRSVTEMQGYKRMAYVKNDGSFTTTDGYKGNFADKKFFISSMMGEMVVNEVRTDRLGRPDKINVISVPVFDARTNEIDGVLFATLISSVFDDFMEITAFKGEADAYMITKDGKLIVNSTNNAVKNVDDFFENFKADNEAGTIDQLKKAILSKKAGLLTLKHQGSRYFYYMPITERFGSNTMYFLLSVPKDNFSAFYLDVTSQIRRILLFALGAILLAAAFYARFRNKQEAALKAAAYMDNLTEGNNLAYFKDTLVGNEDWHGSYVVNLDCADFHAINAKLGMKKGDEVLKAMYQLLVSKTKQNVIVARESQDNFVMAFLQTGKEEMEAVLADITADFRDLPKKLMPDEALPTLRPFFGVYSLDDLGKDFKKDDRIVSALSDSTIKEPLESEEKRLEKLQAALERADEVKRTLKNSSNLASSINIAYYGDKDRNAALEKQELVDGFDAYLDSHAFEMYYQPKFSTSTGKLVAAEALVRLFKEVDGKRVMVPPYKFISLYEKNGLIARLDEYIYHTVCEEQRAWQKDGVDIVPVSINLSQASLFDMAIVDRYADFRDKLGLSSETIQIEITESATTLKLNVKDLIVKFHEKQFKVLCDDFGSGYSSLATLNELPFDIVKLDKSLIDYIKDPKGWFLVQKISEFCRNYNMHITAEGVEDLEQAKLLQTKLHEDDAYPLVDDIQGYVYSKPVPKADFEKMLREHKSVF